MHKILGSRQETHFLFQLRKLEQNRATILLPALSIALSWHVQLHAQEWSYEKDYKAAFGDFTVRLLEFHEFVC